MNKYILILTFGLTFNIGFSQNLIPNGSFELKTSCPTYIGQIDSCLFWINPTIETPDYFSVCATSYVGVPNNILGFQTPHAGESYCGIGIYSSFPSTNRREYIEVPLTDSLISNTCYYLEMYVNLSNAENLTSDAIGAYFSDTLISGLGYGVINLIPQFNNTINSFPDSMNWLLVSGNYTAVGGEKYLIIGNFKDDANTTLQAVNTTGVNSVYFYIDDVSLSICTGIADQNKEKEITVYPVPVYDKLYVKTKNSGELDFKIFDLLSIKVMEKAFTGSLQIDTKMLEAGIYLYVVSDKSGVIRKGKILKQ